MVINDVFGIIRTFKEREFKEIKPLNFNSEVFDYEEEDGDTVNLMSNYLMESAIINLVNIFEITEDEASDLTYKYLEERRLSKVDELSGFEPIRKMIEDKKYLDSYKNETTLIDHVDSVGNYMYDAIYYEKLDVRRVFWSYWDFTNKLQSNLVTILEDQFETFKENVVDKIRNHDDE